MTSISLNDWPERIFVTGTDTDVGKSVVSSLLCRGLGAYYWKPVQAGTEPATDSERVAKWAGLKENRLFPETYCLHEPMSPHAAAELEGIEIELSHFNMPTHPPETRLVVEGAGGLLVPLNRREYIIDLMKKLDIPVLLVGRSGLGTINHTLLSIMAIREAGLKLHGVVLNGDYHSSNMDAIRHFGSVKRVYSLPLLRFLKPDHLENAFNQTFFH
ncbi:MAG: dethiobiotin synthase [Balneolaceae bacterium]